MRIFIIREGDAPGGVWGCTGSWERRSVVAWFTRERARCIAEHSYRSP